MPSNTFSEPPLIAEIDCVLGCIKSFIKGTSCGRDGLRAQHILDALCGEGEVSAYLAEFVASAPLTPLLKPDNGIRPIAVGTIWRRLVSKVAMKGVGKEMSKYLGDFQFGVGVQQGDPLRPLLFALVLHPLIHKIRDRDSCKLLLHAWYLDDGTVIGDSEEVSRVLDILTVSGPGLGLELNIKKTEIFWPSCNGTKLREGLFHVDIRRPSLSVKLLRGATYRTRRGLRGSIENIVVCGGPFFEDLQWSLASLPIRFGGLGLYSGKLVSSYAFVASRAQSWVLEAVY
ncbi:putative reverse transcriptase domain-containing protein [Tanacetum coccineum]